MASSHLNTTIADRVLINGTIITMDQTDKIAQAVALKDGIIIAVGDTATLEKYIGNTTTIDDLQGMACLPGFIDAHSHLTLTGLTLVSVDLSSPPRGTIETIADLKQKLITYKKSMKTDEFPWIVGAKYDNTALQENRHPTREDLDEISTTIPIFLLHISGHMGVANSKALELAGIDATTPDPSGGCIGRYPNSQEPNGLLEEHAMLALLAVMPKPDERMAHMIIQTALHAYASNGITTAQEGFAAYGIVELLKEASQAGILNLDVVMYASFVDCHKTFAAWDNTRKFDHLSLGGIKLVLDGSIQGYTAYLSQPYYKMPSDKPADYRGYPAFADQNELNALVEQALKNKWQILAHANGDAAIDQFLSAVDEALKQHPTKDHRTVLIHAQTIRPDQLAKVKQLSILPSYFPCHIYYWGDKHRDIFLGPERAEQLDPARSTLKLGMRCTFHHDSPVTPLSIIDIIWSAVTRITLSGDILGQQECVSVLDALRAVTIDAAWQYRQEQEKGTIEVGKRADLVILSKNPLAINPSDLRSIKVVQTIKDGKTIYKKH